MSSRKTQPAADRENLGPSHHLKGKWGILELRSKNLNNEMARGIDGALAARHGGMVTAACKEEGHRLWPGPLRPTGSSSWCLYASF